MYNMPTKSEVERIKREYPVGTIIEMMSMSDPYSSIEEGMQGEVIQVDDVGTLQMKWNNGRTLGVIVGEDDFKVISRPEEQEYQGYQMK